MTPPIPDLLAKMSAYRRALLASAAQTREWRARALATEAPSHPETKTP